MFLHRLASGLVFLTGGAMSRVGLDLESWPLMALGLIAATVGLWHFLLGGTATGRAERIPDVGEPTRARGEAGPVRQP